MSNRAMITNTRLLTAPVISQPDAASEAALPISITKAASQQTYYTIRLLADRGHALNAYRAYAYFRWVDDQLDTVLSNHFARLAFVERQQTLIDACYDSDQRFDLLPEERIAAHLIASDQSRDSGLHAYIRSMMEVMTFDANRRGRLISQNELDRYSLALATAVTEALHYFIGHEQFALQDDTRYLAVNAAHITHMLRDTQEDIAAGYFNIPREVVVAGGINPYATDSLTYREWVESRVQLAREYFRAGKAYLARVKCRRCRLAGFAYTVRFERLLDLIERDGYRLRTQYPDGKGMKSMMSMVGSALWVNLRGGQA